MGQYQLGQENRRYNPEALVKYFRFRPWLVWGRILTITWFFSGFVLGMKTDEWFGKAEQNQPLRATQLRKIITRLGPTFIKVGQALSTRPDLIRKDFLEELIKLQDQLPPYSNAIAFQTIEKELGRPLEEVYSEITPNPVAAASLGQVYQARLHSGEEVAVKVQRPNLRPVLNLDLYLMRWAAGWLAPRLPLNLGHDCKQLWMSLGQSYLRKLIT